ncbi:MAG: hypothetical protein V4709_06485 [Pseudomonadota bacterium]
MQNKILMAVALAASAAAIQAQTPLQETGSVQAGAAVQAEEPFAAAQSISIEGISPQASGPLNSTAPDSGPQPWKDVMGWITLTQGMSPDEVKALLGPDYRESVNAKGTIWTFQDQKALLFGSVSFKDGKLEAWTSPRF